MDNLFIANYCFDELKNRYVILDDFNYKCNKMPKSFHIVKSEKNYANNAKYKVFCVDFDGICYKSGLREVKPTIFYCDRWRLDEPKSFMILRFFRFMGSDYIEMYFILNWCPNDRVHRSAFLTKYYENRGIANALFKYHPRTSEQKRLYRKSKLRGIN